MPKLRVLALSIGMAATAAMLSMPGDAGAQRRKAEKKPAFTPECTDFHAYANGAWLAANPVVPGSGVQSALGQLADNAHAQQLALLDEYMQNAQGGTAKLLGDFWASGLAEAAIERDGANPIAPLLSRIDSIRRSKDIPAAVAALHQVGIPVLFNFGADVDLADLGRHIGYFSQGGLGLPGAAYYTRTDADTAALMGRYRDYVGKILVLTGSKPEQLEADIQAVMDLETRIARASKPPSLMRDPRDNYALVAVAGLDQQFRNLQLQSFLQAQGVADDSVSLANPQLFAQLDALVDELKPAQWKTYLRYQVGASMAPYLSKAWRDVDFDFRGVVLRGETAPPERRQQVLDAMNHAAGPMIGREYIGRYLPPETRARAAEIAVEVRDALGRGIDRNTWMSPQAKAEAKAKLANLKIEVGAPMRDLDFTVQPMGRGSFGGNMLIASTWRHREEMKRIGRGNADRRWNVLPQQPALAYDPAQNRLIVTAAVLQSPVLGTTRPDAANYGAYGALVGHELSHGFDAVGRHIDATGALRDWWSPADATAWGARLASLAAQYGGEPRGEDAADLGGVELALDALLTAQPQLDLAGKQAFYTGWAGLWPTQMSPEVAAQASAIGLHAPARWRSNGPLMNDPGFAEAFSCKPGAPMQVPAGQQIHIWR